MRLDHDNQPLHIKSLAEQSSHNGYFQELADNIEQYAPWEEKGSRANEAYFYAFKDAFEKSGYDPTEGDIMDAGEEAYRSLEKQIKAQRGFTDEEWDEYGYPDFEEEYGTIGEFIGRMYGALQEVGFK